MGCSGSGFLSTSCLEVSSDDQLFLVTAAWFVCFSTCSPTIEDISDLPFLVSCSLEVSELFGVLLSSVSMATLEAIPPDVVKATVGVTVTVLAVVTVHSALLVEQELDSVFTVDVLSLLVIVSNCNTKQSSQDNWIIMII